MFNSFHINGVKAFDANNYGIAKDFFLKAIEANPETAESYFYLGKCYFFCDEQQQAISHLNKFIELSQSQSDEVANVSFAFDLLGQCYAADNKNTDALRCYEKATKIYPSCASAWNNMGLFYMKSALNYLDEDLANSAKLFENALDFIKKALEICSDNPVFLHSLASWYEKYIKVLKKVIEDEEPKQKNIASNFNYAIQYYKKALLVCHEQDGALRKIIESNFTECLAQYGHHLYQNKDYKNAQKAYLKAKRFDPEHLPAINQIGMCLFKQGCFSEARDYFRSILVITQKITQKKQEIADASLKQEIADAWLKQEIADAWLNIACTYRLEKKWEKAKIALSRAKEFAPEDDSIAEEKMKLMAALSPQTLFDRSNPGSQGADGTDQESRFKIPI